MAFSGSGFIKRTGDKVREYVDDPDASAKWSDPQVKDQIRRAFADVYSDINRQSTCKVHSRVTIEILEDVAEYVLPPTIAQFLALEERSDDTDNFERENLIPLDPLSPWGPGFTIQGNILVFDPRPTVTDTLRLRYVPSGEAPIFEGVAAGTSTKTTVATDTVTEGTRDLRDQAYTGYEITELNGTGEPLQHRMITGYDGTELTIAPALATAWTGSETFEVVPMHAYRLEDVVALRVARFFANISGDNERAVGLNNEYKDTLRTLRLDKAYMEQRVGQRFKRSVRGKRRSRVAVVRR